MDAIKKKMQSLKSETDNSLARAEQLDTEAKEANTLAEKTEEHVSYTLFLWITTLYYQSELSRCDMNSNLFSNLPCNN